MSETEHPKVDVKKAITIAKTYIREIFSEEEIRNLGLEEVLFQEMDNEWHITVGFSRPWDAEIKRPYERLNEASGLSQPEIRRSYKIVVISADTGKASKTLNRSDH